MEHNLRNADIQYIVKKFFKLAAVLVLLSAALPANGYFVTYKEQYYRLFHVHHNQYPDDTMENIYWLEQALKADFANPLYALALIENEVQWEKYRYLFTMHIYIKLIEQYMFLGNKWNKRNAYFYNAPWRDQNIESLEIAETCFRTALYYWDEATAWAEKANERRFRWIHLERVQFWEDEAFRIESGALNYRRTVERELASLQRVRERFEAMENSY
ncbi:MAG: hypothetical protein LBQ89_08385 [Treponema sp.]|jgi:hypothetical protein|nr:hypothetical protein [Treponema sp.]